MTNDICQSLAAVIFSFNRFISNPFSNYEEYLGKVCIVRSKNSRIVALIKGQNNGDLIRTGRKIEYHPIHRTTKQDSPFNKITQIIKGVNSLFFVLIEWQP